MAVICYGVFGSMAFKVCRVNDSRNLKNVRENGGKRGYRDVIVTFSKSAKRNFLWRLQSLDFDKLKKYGYKAYFVTLTYQDKFFLSNRNMKLAKRDLDRLFRREIKKFLGDDWFSFWKLEYHKSGIPHFHLFVIVSGKFTYNEVQRAFNKAWVISACFDAPEKVRKSMFNASTQVRSCKLNLKHVLMVYISKEIGKEFQIESKNGELPGRFWGIYNRKLYNSFVRKVVYDMSEEVFYRYRRIVKRWLKSKGYKLKLRSRNGVKGFYVEDISAFEALITRLREG